MNTEDKVNELQAELSKAQTAGQDRERQLAGQLRKAERQQAEAAERAKAAVAEAALAQARPMAKQIDGHLSDALASVRRAIVALHAAQAAEPAYEELRTRRQLALDKYDIPPLADMAANLARELARQVGEADSQPLLS